MMFHEKQFLTSFDKSLSPITDPFMNKIDTSSAQSNTDTMV